MCCRAATLAATVEGLGFPLSMTDGREEQRLKEEEDERMRDAIAPHLPLFIKDRGWGSAALLGQSRYERRREPGPTRRPIQQRPGFPPPPFATQAHGRHVADVQN